MARKVTQERINEMRELERGGLSPHAAGKKIGVAASTASYIARGGYTMEGYKKWIRRDMEKKASRKDSIKNKKGLFPPESLITPEICREVKIATLIDGLSAKEVAKRVKIGESTVYTIKGVKYDFKAYKEKTREYSRRHEGKKSNPPELTYLKKELEDMVVMMKKINIRLSRFKEETTNQLNRIEALVGVEIPQKEKGTLGRFLGKF